MNTIIQNDISSALKSRKKMSNYDNWIYMNIKHYIGDRVLDIGSGIGTFLHYYEHTCKLVIGTDIFDPQVQQMKDCFKGGTNVEICQFEINKDDISKFKERNIDTVTCINVLEHIKDDRLALSNMKDVLIEGGKIVILVPAYSWLYGSMDIACGHHRRYDKGQLKKLASELGLKVICNKYMNVMGIIPWFIKGKVLRKKSTFSESVSGNNMGIYNFSAKLLMEIENNIKMSFGISEIIILEKQ